MKRIKLISYFLLILLLSAHAVSALEFPAPVGYVNDFANILNQEQETALNGILGNFE